MDFVSDMYCSQSATARRLPGTGGSHEGSTLVFSTVERERTGLPRSVVASLECVNLLGWAPARGDFAATLALGLANRVDQFVGLAPRLRIFVAAFALALAQHVNHDIEGARKATDFVGTAHRQCRLVIVAAL